MEVGEQQFATKSAPVAATATVAASVGPLAAYDNNYNDRYYYYRYYQLVLMRL